MKKTFPGGAGKAHRTLQRNIRIIRTIKISEDVKVRDLTYVLKGRSP